MLVGNLCFANPHKNRNDTKAFLTNSLQNDVTFISRLTLISALFSEVGFMTLLCRDLTANVMTALNDKPNGAA